MKHRQIVIAVAMIITCVNCGCRSFPYMIGLKRVPLDEAAPRVESAVPHDPMTNQMLTAGRAIYVNRCTQCHPAIPVHEYAGNEWEDSIIPRMAPRAQLTTEETRWLQYYIAATLNLSSRPVSAGETSQDIPESLVIHGGFRRLTPHSGDQTNQLQFFYMATESF